MIKDWTEGAVCIIFSDDQGYNFIITGGINGDSTGRLFGYYGL